MYSPVFSLATGWVVGRIESHTAKPLTESEVTDACNKLNGAARADAIEECAKVMDAWAKELEESRNFYDVTPVTDNESVAKKVRAKAANIRARKDKP